MRMKVDVSKPKTISRWTWIALAIPLLALSPLLYMQCRLLLLKPHLQFFPLAVAGAAYFLSAKDQEVASQRERRFALPAWIAIVVLCGIALYLGSPWLAHLSAILLVGVWGLGARPGMSVLRILGICGLLLVTLPPPFGWDKQLVSSLQSISSLACSRLMDLTSILHVRRGNIIEVTSKPLFVEEACSGVDSQYALMAVAGVLLLVGRAGLIVSLLTILTVPIWAILGNLLRIYAIVIGLEWLGVDLSSGTAHTLLGLLVFGFTAWVHWSSVQLLNYLQLTLFSNGATLGSGARRTPASFAGRADPMELRYGWIALPLALMFFFPESLRAVADYHASPDLPSISLEDSERFPGAGALVVTEGAQVVGFQTKYRDRDDMLGQHSRVWELKADLGRMSVCLDFPFRGWHPLWECYINAGWERIRSDLINSSDEPFFETLFLNDLGDIAVLHFSLFDEDGRPYAYEGSLEFRQQAQRWTNTLFTRKRPGDRIDEPMTFQFQQITYINSIPNDQQLNSLRRRFIDNRRCIVTQSAVALQALKQKAPHVAR